MAEAKTDHNAPPRFEELLARAEGLIAVLRERAPRAEALRRLPDETIADLRSSGLFRMLQPARVGGSELPFRALFELTAVIGQGCGSTAWVLANLAAHHWLLGMWHPEAQDEIWGGSPDSLISSALIFPRGRARRVEGGYRLSGRWPFSSGVDYSTWNMFGAVVSDEETGQSEPRMFLVPASDYTVIDTWQVIGLAGTGSKTFEIKEAFVPAHRILDKKAADEGNAPGAKLYAAPCFHLPRGGPSIASFAAVTVGIAEGCLEEYYNYTRPRKSRGTPVAALAGTQITAATAAAEIEAAVRMYLGVLREAMGILERGEPFTKDHQVQGKRNMAYAAMLSIHAVQRLYNDAGGRVLYADNELQRKFRDAHAAAAHHSLNWHTAAEEYGRHVLGVDE